MDNLMRERQDFLEKFKSSGLPSPSNEDWKYTNVKSLDKYLKFYEGVSDDPVKPSELAEFLIQVSPLKNHVVIVNGKWLKDQSSFKDVATIDSPSGGPEGEFSNLNQAFLQENLEIKFPKAQKTAIEIIHISTEHKAYNSRLVLHVAEQAEVEVVESFYSMGSNERFFNSTTIVQMRADSRLRHVLLEDVGAQSSIISSVVARLSKGATAYFLNAAYSYVWSRNNMNIYLDGEGAEVFLNALYTPADGQVIDHCTKIIHRIPQTTSHQLYKGVLVGKSKAIFNGKIKIEKDAQKSATDQLNKNIVLENRSEAITRPQLEIAADDVKATHGATVGKLSEDELFYLESRGIPESLAKKVLIQGFVKEVLDISVEGDVRRRVEKSLNLERLVNA